MNPHLCPRDRRRAPRWLALVLTVALGLGAAAPAAARAHVPVPVTPAAAGARLVTIASWYQVFNNRGRMIQVATVFMAIGIFILTRGRWK